MKRHLYDFVLCFLVFIAVICSFIVGYNWPVIGYYVSASEEITIRQAAGIIEGALTSHQYYIDHPETVTNKTGTVEDNIRWVENYRAIQRLLVSLEK